MAELHGAFWYCSENSPPTSWPNSTAADVHQHQREQEARDGEPEEADDGDDIVADRILAHRREDADRQRDAPRWRAASRSVSTSVSAIRSQIRPLTGCCHSNDRPKSPRRTMPLIHFQYCTSIGWSRPKRSRSVGGGVLVDDLVRGGERRDIGRDVVARRQLDQHEGEEADQRTATASSRAGV